MKYFEKYEQDIHRIIHRHKVPGLSIALVDGNSIYSDVFGLKNIAKNELVTKNTVFETASLTKPVVAYITLVLNQENLIELDKPLFQYLDQPYLTDQPLYEQITATHVLAHSTGFPNWRKGDELKIEFKPGERFQYSGEGYVYLQKVLEAVTDLELNELAEKHVFKPFNMTNSSLTWLNRFDHDYTYRHNTDSHPSEIKKWPKANAAYSLYSTANDYAKFIRVMLNITDHLNQHNCSKIYSRITAIRPAAYWGLGWGVEETPQKICWHWGDNGYFKAVTCFMPSQNTGIVLLTNGYYGLYACQEILNLVYRSCKSFEEIIKLCYSKKNKEY